MSESTRKKTWSIKEQLDLNSFLLSRTILAEEAWLTEPAAASDLMTARQTYWVPPGWRRNQGCALSMKKQPPSSVFPLFPSEASCDPCVKERDQRQSPQSLGWTPLSTDWGNCWEQVAEILVIISVYHFAHFVWGVLSSWTSVMVWKYPPPREPDIFKPSQPPGGSKGIFCFSCTCITFLFLCSPLLVGCCHLPSAVPSAWGAQL